MDNIQKNLIISSRVKERRKRTRVLWDAAHKRLCELYGDMPDVRILNRFYSEKMIFENTDNPIIWDVIGAIRERARERGELISLSGTDGCCLCAHLLGAAETQTKLRHAL